MGKITLALPKGSQIEMVVRRYVATHTGQASTNGKIARLKDVTITAEYEVVEART